MIFNQHRKKMLFVFALIAVIAITNQSFKAEQQEEPKKLKNIKVFPSTMTFKEVDHAMDQFKMALGVKCNYCHAPSKDNPKKMDMASDDNPKKDIARDMLRMTMEMNQKYISAIPHESTDTAKVQMITCNTCHRGAPKPFGKAPAMPPPPPPQGK